MLAQLLATAAEATTQAAAQVTNHSYGVLDWFVGIGSLLGGGGLLAAVIGMQRSKFRDLCTRQGAVEVKAAALDVKVAELNTTVTDIQTRCFERAELYQRLADTTHRIDKNVTALATAQGLKVD